MNKIEQQNIIKQKKLIFGDLADEILLNIDDSGLVYYTKDEQGKKIYGLPSSPPVYSEHYSGRSQTQQQFRDECDINLVLKKYNVHHDYVPGQVQIALENFRDLTLAPSVS